MSDPFSEQQEIARELASLSLRRTELQRQLARLDAQEGQTLAGGLITRTRAELAAVAQQIATLEMYTAADGCTGPHCPR